jgi:hypothetical protein
MTEDKELGRVLEIHDALREVTQAWVRSEDWDEEEAQRLREEAVLLNHKRYFRSIPAYRALAEDVGVDENVTDVEVIKADLMFATDIFKSYDPTLIDNADWQQMTVWLRTVFGGELPGDYSNIESLEEWLAKLMEAELNIMTSSGTSGQYSFVPRDMNTRMALMMNSALVFQPFFAKVLENISEYDAAILNFSSGSAGVQAASNSIGNIVQTAHYLYDMHMPADAVRVLQRGPKNDEERKFIEEFERVMTTEKDLRYEVMLDNIRASLKKGKKILMQGACYQLKELCTKAVEQGSVILPEGSILLFGGGWKTFEGEKMGKTELLQVIDAAFGLKGDSAIEGYSMIEMNTMMTCCSEARFHIPPLIEPIVLDEDLLPKPGAGHRGIFGFLDPFALSYPGFLISGDEINLWHGECSCGRKGYAIDGEIQRVAGKEVKGCGGVMASVKA